VDIFFGDFYKIKKLTDFFQQFENKYQGKHYDRERELLNKYLSSLKNKDVLTPFREYINNSSNNCLDYFNNFFEYVKYKIIFYLILYIWTIKINI
jgi:hypothetical protein